MATKRRLPEWLKVRHMQNKETEHVAGLIGDCGLHSVCQSAHCPNRSECWASGTASFMIMGEFCTRACRFCTVKTSPKPPLPDPEEPEKLAKAVASLGLRYVVITSVTRDDLPDFGAGHFASCVAGLRKIPGLIIEALVPDFLADEGAIKTILESPPDVVSHNIETVKRLSPVVRDRRAGYGQSLNALRLYRRLSGGKVITKSGLMAGLGETDGEVLEAMADLREAGVDLLTIGQYLAPSASSRHLPVARFVKPEVFREYERRAYGLGFKYAASGPFVRSSYRAAEPFIRGLISPGMLR